MHNLKPERPVRKAIYQKINSFLKLKQEIVKIPKSNRNAERDTILHSPDVAGVVIDKSGDEPKIILEKQWRESVNAFTLETPAGKIDSRDKKDPHHAIIRELNEELRVSPQTLKLLTPKSLYNSPGCTTEATYFYYATNLKPVHKKLPRDLGEYMKLIKLPLSQTFQLIDTGKIRDMKTVLAVMYWYLIDMKEHHE